MDWREGGRMDGGVMGKFFINHTQKDVMDWREVSGILCFGWEMGKRWAGSVERRARLFSFSVYPLTYIYRFGFYMKDISLEIHFSTV
jgi:hypothetical protein